MRKRRWVHGCYDGSKPPERAHTLREEVVTEYRIEEFARLNPLYASAEQRARATLCKV